MPGGSRAGRSLLEAPECLPCFFNQTLVRACDTAAEVCVPKVRVGFVLSGLPLEWSEAGTNVVGPFFNGASVTTDAYMVSVSRFECPFGFYLPGSSRLCMPCRTCKPWESFVSPCATERNTVCAGVVDVVFEINGTTHVGHPQFMDLVGGLLNLSSGWWAGRIASRERVEVIVRNITCPPGTTLNLNMSMCLPCVSCAAGSYFLSAACLDGNPGTCTPCTVCEEGRRVVKACSPLEDTVCGGSVSVQFVAVNVSESASERVQELLDRLMVGSQGILDLGFLSLWLSLHGHNVSLLDSHKTFYNMRVVSKECGGNSFFSEARQGCAPCAVCASGSFETGACAGVNDTRCSPCKACGMREYAAVGGCRGSSDTWCFAYTAREVRILLRVVTELYGPYEFYYFELPRILFAMQEQLLAADYALVEFISDGTVYEAVALFKSVFARNLPLDRDASVIAERSIAYSAALNASANATSSALRRRRLLQEQGGCLVDTYLVFFSGINASRCIPCQDDPVPGVTRETPPLLWSRMASQACPSGFARVCYGGYAQPVCEVFSRSVVLLSANITSANLSCPANQVPSLDPSTHLEICVGVPCGAGQGGRAGACYACQPGTFKNFTGDSVCSPCPAGTFRPGFGGASAVDCAPCPVHSESVAGSSACLCSAGYVWDPFGDACSGCPAGHFKHSSGAGNCLGCPAGSSSAAGASICVPCPAGSFSGASSTACTACHAGYFQASAGSSHCSQCPNGTSPASSRSTCDQCAAGTAGVGGFCSACPAPFEYSSSPSSTACLSCSSGSYSSQDGQSSCSGCRPGTAGTGCRPCPRGTFSSGAAQTSCDACFQGLTTFKDGSWSNASCSACPSSTYLQAGSGACVQCPDNTESPAGSVDLAECMASAGFYSVPGQAGLPCPEGYFCVEGSMAPVRCKEGFWARAGSQRCYHLVNHDNPLLDWVTIPVWTVVTVLAITFVVRARRSLLS